MEDLEQASLMLRMAKKDYKALCGMGDSFLVANRRRPTPYDI